MPAIIDATSNIDISLIDSIFSADQAHLDEVHARFFEGVEELKLLLRDDSILYVPTSMGKDSSVTLLMALQAYKELIEAGDIEPSRPLVSATVNTGMENISMTLYVAYARKHLLDYAARHNINLQHSIVMPPLNDQYFVRFAGAQKLIANSARNGDCSVILKVVPAQKHLKSVLEKTGNSHRKVVCIVGSRIAEGSRRAGNMQKQGIRSKSIAELQSQLTQVNVGQSVIQNFAPIRDWSTDDVFSALRIAGDKPLTHTTKKIPGFLSNYGLLAEIYGNGSNEVCSVAVGETNAGSGCNGRARFGCTQCSMIGATDKSSTAMDAYARWNVLGVGNATRVRDFLFRLSTDMKARSFHARAYDPTAFSRVVFQPNTLRVQHLEKMVRFAAQLTLDSIRIADEFKQLKAQGRELEHPGYKEIAEDPSLPPKVKKAFLEMYADGICDPRNLNYLFDMNHALLLSARWALDGIAAAPFRPLAILKQLESGKGWLPYPELNSEIEARTGKAVKLVTGDLPEAVVFRVFTDENATEFAVNPLDALSLWTRPADISDLHDEEFNCTVSRKADHYARADITFKPSVSFYVCDLAKADIIATVEGVFTGYRFASNSPSVSSVTLNGKVLSQNAAALLLDTGLNSAMSDYIDTRLDALLEQAMSADLSGSQQDVETVLTQLVAGLLGEATLVRSVRHLRSTSLFAGYCLADRKVEPAINFTKRVASIKKGKVIKANTRLNFYALQNNSRLHQAHSQYTDLLVPDFSTHSEKAILTHDLKQQADLGEALMENIQVREDGISLWLQMGGLERALDLHDAFFKAKFKQRSLGNKVNLRAYGGTFPAEYLIENGVVSIAKSYVAQYQFILRRTQFFDQLGFFSFQSMDHATLLSHPKAISMKTHRSDKAELLKHVRKIRNVQRMKVRVALLGQEMGNYNSLVSQIHENLQTFEAVAKDAIYQMSTGLVSSLLHLRFHTHDVAVRDMATVNQLWSQLYLTDAGTTDHLLQAVLTQAQHRTLKTSPTDYLQTTKLVAAMAHRLTHTIDRELSVWAGTIAKLKSLLQIQTTDSKAPIAAYRAIIEASPYGLDGHDNLRWNPSLAGFKASLSNNLARIDQVMHQLSKTKCNLDLIGTEGQIQVSRKLSLADKLSVLALRVA